MNGQQGFPAPKQPEVTEQTPFNYLTSTREGVSSDTDRERAGIEQPLPTGLGPSDMINTKKPDAGGEASQPGRSQSFGSLTDARVKPLQTLPIDEVSAKPDGVPLTAISQPNASQDVKPAVDIEGPAVGELPATMKGKSEVIGAAPQPAHDLDKKPNRTFKDTMTWGEQLLYHKCLSRLNAHDEFVRAQEPREQFQALLDWIAGTTFLLSKDDFSLKFNMMACTYARAMRDSPTGEFPGEIPIIHMTAIARHLHGKIVQKVAEFRSRDPATYKPTQNWFKRAWADLDCEPTFLLLITQDIDVYCYEKHLDSSLAHRINMEWIFVQILLWVAITLGREAFSERKGTALPISAGEQVAAVIFPLIALILAVKYLPHKEFMWKFAIRGAWLAYSLWFAFATNMDDLKYLVAPFVLCIVMYVLTWKKKVIQVWVTYTVGLAFMLVTFIVYIATEAPITWKNFLLMFYLYNTWIGIHLDIILAKMMRRILTDRRNLGPSEFMSWFMFTTGFVFHFLTIILLFMLFNLAGLLLICLGLYIFVRAEYEKAKREITVTYHDDFSGANRAVAQMELDRLVANATEARRNLPPLVAFFMFTTALLFLLIAFILICILVPSPCMFKIETPQPVPQRFEDIDESDKLRLRSFQEQVSNSQAEERAILEATIANS